jgi:LysM repeat protein
MVDNCDDFYLVQSGETCDSITAKKGITLAQFTAWNKGVGTGCTSMWADVYVCTSIIGHTPTPTDPGNGIETPAPIQPGMVGNCDAFYLIKSGDSCAAIAFTYGISINQFTTWNSGVGTTCSGMWADVYACVSIVGHTPTPTDPGNGIQTPTPIQNGMTKNCKRFHFVKSGEACATITKQYGISLADFLSWNPAAGSNCAGLWANTYACVAVL